MAHSNALKDIGTPYDSNTVFYNPSANSRPSAGVTPKEPVNFNIVFKERYNEDRDIFSETFSGTQQETGSVFSSGSAIDMMSVMSQMKDVSFEDEFDAFGVSEDLDSAIGFDEIEELDGITDDEAAQIESASQNDIFGSTDVFEDSALLEDDLSTFGDIEEII